MDATLAPVIYNIYYGVASTKPNVLKCPKRHIYTYIYKRNHFLLALRLKSPLTTFVYASSLNKKGKVIEKVGERERECICNGGLQRHRAVHNENLSDGK